MVLGGIILILVILSVILLVMNFEKSDPKRNERLNKELQKKDPFLSVASSEDDETNVNR